MKSARGLQEASAALSRLAAQQSRLESRLAALGRMELQAQRDMERAQRDRSASGGTGTRLGFASPTHRLEAAQRSLERVQRERAEITAELPGLKLARQEVIRRVASPAWAELQARRAEEYAAGVALATQVEVLVAPYSERAAEAALIKTELDSLLAALGPDALSIRKALACEVAETLTPNSPEDRQALRRAQQIRNVYSQELSYRW